MRKQGFISDEELKDIAGSHQTVRDGLNSDQLRTAQETDRALSELNGDIFNFESESKVRKAGFTPQQAKDIANIVKTKQIGEIFQYKNKQLVLTPFKTVVDAQVYLTTLQNRLLEVTTVSAEIEILTLKKTINEFTSLSFFDLIKLSFTRLFTKGNKNG